MDKDEPEDKAGRSFNVVVLASFGATSALAIFAIVLCLYLLNENSQDDDIRACTRRIDLYVGDIRDEINVQGWDALVSRAQGNSNEDVQTIANRMRDDINSLQSPQVREMRDRAIQICDEDPSFQPR